MAENAWKQDSDGYFVEMIEGEKKDYSLQWDEADTINSMEMTIGSGITQVGNTEINGKVSKFVLHANGGKGVFSCQAKMTPGAGVPIEILPFRVVVK